jgi:hypothetical protein
MPVDPKDYEKNRAYYLARERTPEAKAKRAVRQKARAEAVKDGRLNGQDDPREVDHKTPLSKGGGNGKGNTRVVSQTANRKKYDR